MLDVLKVAISDPAFGTQSPPAQLQLLAVLQSPLTGVGFHIALPQTIRPEEIVKPLAESFCIGTKGRDPNRRGLVTFPLGH
jgi:hypothetical protein